MMQLGVTKPRKLEDSGEPSFKWSQDFVNSTCAAGERETPRFEVVSLFFFLEQFMNISFSAISDEFVGRASCA